MDPYLDLIVPGLSLEILGKMTKNDNTCGFALMVLHGGRITKEQNDEQNRKSLFMNIHHCFHKTPTGRNPDGSVTLIVFYTNRYSPSLSGNAPPLTWGEVFPSAACVVSLIDRLVHHSEIEAIEGKSYRMKEATEQARKRQKGNAT